MADRGYICVQSDNTEYEVDKSPIDTGNTRCRPKTDENNNNTDVNNNENDNTDINNNENHITDVNNNENHITDVNINENHITDVNNNENHTTDVNNNENHITDVNNNENDNTDVNNNENHITDVNTYTIDDEADVRVAPATHTVHEVYKEKEDWEKNLMKWNERRRVVEISVLSEFLEKGCHACGWMLKLSNTFQERHYGPGSLLYIKCAQETCGTITTIPTGKRHGKYRYS
ncbi:ras-related protein RabX-like [Mizuhopecten yessoensis]|uniref:ras-related protein RabX-like n=1 Tax=Mizuhopecten yessoensis TaxID=6573 RepID=UPI000B45C035|nr:ras-related protein RabX-like [Mizuhopecten yessoensis]